MKRNHFETPQNFLSFLTRLTLRRNYFTGAYPLGFYQRLTYPATISLNFGHEGRELPNSTRLAFHKEGQKEKYTTSAFAANPLEGKGRLRVVLEKFASWAPLKTES